MSRAWATAPAASTNATSAVALPTPRATAGDAGVVAVALTPTGLDQTPAAYIKVYTWASVPRNAAIAPPPGSAASETAWLDVDEGRSAAADQTPAVRVSHRICEPLLET
jgi:hypothetical protein